MLGCWHSPLGSWSWALGRSRLATHAWLLALGFRPLAISHVHSAARARQSVLWHFLLWLSVPMLGRSHSAMRTQPSILGNSVSNISILEDSLCKAEKARNIKQFKLCQKPIKCWIREHNQRSWTEWREANGKRNIQVIEIKTKKLLKSNIQMLRYWHHNDHIGSQMVLYELHLAGNDKRKRLRFLPN